MKAKSTEGPLGDNCEDIYIESDKKKAEGRSKMDKFKMDPVKSSQVASEIRGQVVVSGMSNALHNGSWSKRRLHPAGPTSSSSLGLVIEDGSPQILLETGARTPSYKRWSESPWNPTIKHLPPHSILSAFEM